jgi:sterol desaturase/sphingolipid hydroxylase (fatty acid hydroxylase superfamily)
MWDELLAAYQTSQQWLGALPLLLVAVLFFVPFELFIPRILSENVAAQRSLAIAGMALIGGVAIQAYAWWAQTSIIEVFVRFKFFSIAKLPMPDWLLIVISFVVLDFLYFLSHFILHQVPWLWRMHKIHHADEHVTAFSSLLHHPFESLFAAFFITGFVVMLGVPVLIYLYFGLALALHAVFAHANVALPLQLDRKLRLFFVTPDVHRTHHSQNLNEGNSNFGAMFIIWDRLFGTYLDQPAEPVSQLCMGLPPQSKPQAFSTKELLLFPFRGK